MIDRHHPDPGRASRAHRAGSRQSPRWSAATSNDASTTSLRATHDLLAAAGELGDPAINVPPTVLACHEAIRAHDHGTTSTTGDLDRRTVHAPAGPHPPAG